MANLLASTILARFGQVKLLVSETDGRLLALGQPNKIFMVAAVPDLMADNVKPNWQKVKLKGAVELIGSVVQTTNGKKLGQVGDALFDRSTGRLYSITIVGAQGQISRLLDSQHIVELKPKTVLVASDEADTFAWTPAPVTQ